MADLDTLLARLERRRRLQRAADALAPRLLAASLIAATAVATVRLALPIASWAVPACIAAGLLVPLCWLPAAWRQRDARGRLAGELDLLAGTEGTTMALAEGDDTAWHGRVASRLASVVLPPVRLRPLLPAVACVALLAGAGILPQAVPAMRTTGHPAEALVRPVRDDLARLEQAAVITPEERVELEKRLDDLLARAGGGMLDQATWEGIDRLQAHLDTQAGAAGEKLAAALALAQAGLDQPPADEREAAQLASSLASAVAALAEQAPGLVPADLHDPAAQQAFAQALAQAQAKGLISEAQRAALEKAGLKPGKPGSSPSPGQARALARRLADELQKRKQGLGTCSGGTAADAFLAKLRAGSRPGRGGVDRGPGSAEISKEPRARTAGGDQEGLAPGATLNPDGSVTVAAQARDAEADPAAREALRRAAAQAFDPTAADSRRATVAPRHRAAVEAYFSEK